MTSTHTTIAVGRLLSALFTDTPSKAKQLTRQQRRVLDFLHAEALKGHPSPSYQEIADHLRVKSKGHIGRIVVALVERGFCVTTPGRVRAIEVIAMPFVAPANPNRDCAG